jgi:hypothetical protein
VRRRKNEGDSMVTDSGREYLVAALQAETEKMDRV